MSMSEEPDGDADVDHVDGQAAQLAVGDELEDELLERNGVEDDVVAERVELEALLVDDSGAGGDGPARPRAPFPGSCRSGHRRRARAMNPSLDARIVNQVGRPWMLDGKRFLPETGIPIWKMARIRMLLEDWLPEPLAVATWIEKSLTTRVATECEAVSGTATSLKDMELLRGEAAELWAERGNI